ncbi:MAG: hypothetical protein IMZ61_10410 [Planctomycetes bacterium]|nr:hypothetical protein [Planctomycetota bacterium]
MKQIAVLCVLAVVLLVGCNGTPMTNYTNTANFAADRFDEMTVLVRLGAFDQKQLQDIKDYTDEAKLCLDEWYVNIKADPNSPNANFDTTHASRCVRRALAKLLWYQDNAPPEMQRQAIKK